MKSLFVYGMLLLIAMGASCDPVLGDGVNSVVKKATLQYTLDRDEDDIKEVSWNADGSLIATTGTNSFSMWNSATGKLLYTIRKHSPRAEVHVSWSPDGMRIATSSDEYAPAGFDIGLISIRNAIDGEVIWTLGKNITLSTPHCMSWSADGKYLSTSEGGLINIWNPDKGYLHNTVRGHTDYVRHIYWSTKSNSTLSASQNEIIIWNSIADEKLFTLNGHTSRINDIDLSSDGTRVVSGSMDKNAIIWEVATGKKLFTLVGHTYDINDVSWSPDCSKIITGATDGGSIIWDASTGIKLFRLEGSDQVTLTVAWSPDGKSVAMNSSKNASIWDASTGKKTLSLVGHSSGIQQIRWSPDGKRIATGSSDGTVKIWLVDEQ
ncbi:MAG: WD40 repeat domain-containing protein [Ignavibacteria bacterium]|nr:WD40 repeat domain-containing protein [Ignavibacteria bacterium]